MPQHANALEISGELGQMSYKIDCLGSKRNYKHVGRVQRRVMRAFIIRPEWSTSALMAGPTPGSCCCRAGPRTITGSLPLRSYGSGAAPRDQVGRFCGGSRHSSEVKVFHTGKRFFITFAYLRSRWERHAYCKSIRRAADRLVIMPRLEAGPGTKKSPTEAGLKL